MKKIDNNNFEKFTIEAIQQAFKTLQTAKATLSEKGWFPATSGNLSVRVKYSTIDDQNQFIIAITSSGKDKSIHTPEDFLLVN